MGPLACTAPLPCCRLPGGSGNGRSSSKLDPASEAQWAVTIMGKLRGLLLDTDK